MAKNEEPLEALESWVYLKGRWQQDLGRTGQLAMSENLMVLVTVGGYACFEKLTHSEITRSFSPLRNIGGLMSGDG